MYPETAQDAERLAADLVTFLRESILDTKGRDEWSQRNFTLLREFTSKQEPTALDYPSDRLLSDDERRGQFLWDFIAYLPNRGILLAAESEFAQDEAGLKHDFEKLLYVRSPIKLFLGRIRNSQEAEHFKDILSAYMTETCSVYSPGEVYILYFVWWSEDKQNRDYAYWLQIGGEPNHVSLNGETFRPVPR